MINIPKGTKDVLPAEAYKWHYVERTVREVAAAYCASEIRTPTFEHTELFLRGVGGTTDIVNKEMYTFDDKGGRSMTLKPEGTAGVARAFIERSLYADAQPTKMYYITPVFRYEKPQSGRLREHHQFGVEFYGSASPRADVEVISLLDAVYKRLGITGLKLHINSIGCRECRKTYNDALKAYFGAHIGEMCDTCRERLDKNPLRILDCKESGCRKIIADAPVVLDYLCDDCRRHHEEVCAGLDAIGIEYSVDPRIVRGLDYYTRTVFEFISEDIGAQGTVGGGGRYDHLLEEIGGKYCPAVGFGSGIERIIMTMEALGVPFGERPRPCVYVAPVGEDDKTEATRIAAKLRSAGVSCETDLTDRGFKAQMKYANKIAARYLVAVGESERASGVYQVKNMDEGTTEAVTADALSEYFANRTEKNV